MRAAGVLQGDTSESWKSAPAAAAAAAVEESHGKPAHCSTTTHTAYATAAGEEDLHELAESTAVVVAHCLGVTECL